MLTLGKALRSFLSVRGMVLLFGIASTTVAQSGPVLNPCDLLSTDDHSEPAPQSIMTTGLVPMDSGIIVYDKNQSVCWLADANLAGNASTQQELGITGINPDGTMDYLTALSWVAAMNGYHGGHGWLGHHNWQLPDNPLDDTTCSSYNNGNFGVSCTGSALGNLYNVGLLRPYPQSVIAHFTNTVGPFLNLQPDLYWSSDAIDNAERTYSFNTRLSGENTTKYNYFYIWAMTPGVIG
jgi:hypothetical protein